MRGSDERRAHYVKPNETTRQPRRLVFLDTEAHIDRVKGGHVQRFAVAVACYVSTRPDRPARERWATYDDQEILWREVSDWCGASGRTVLYTHNLAYDARIAGALATLPALGWTLVAHNLSGKGCWLTWRRERSTLMLCDSLSIFPTTLAQLGKTLGVGKLPMPGRDRGGVGLYSRCWRDVEILRTAVLEYLRWLEDNDMGCWQPTGAGQAWATFRHKFLPRQLLVHDDEIALAAERRALWAGRCEAYWHGELSGQVLHEWDLENAYAHVARTTAVPVRLLGPMPEGFDWRQFLTSDRTGILAEVEVTTDVPVVPTMHQGRIVWPVGRFVTTLWDPELRAAIEAGARVTVRRGWLYRKAPALADWAEWVIGEIRTAGSKDDHWRYIVAKHWARALIGRFAMTYAEWEHWAVAPLDRVRAHQVYDADSGETFDTLQVGRDIWRKVGQREWSQSIPMITGYVQSVCRVRLWEIMEQAPPQSVLYCDTDSVLVTDRHLAAMAAIAEANPDWRLRLKRSWDGFAVWGPRQIRTGPLVRISGVSRTAQRTGPREFTGEVWETLPGAMARGTTDRVVTRDRVWNVKGVDHRRNGPEIGWTAPHHIEEASDDRSADPAERGQRAGAAPRVGGRSTV